MTGFNNTSSSGIPTISSESYNSKDSYVLVSSKSGILQLKSAWACFPSGSTAWSRVHVASDKVVSITPPDKIKYNSIINWYEAIIGWVVIP